MPGEIAEFAAVLEQQGGGLPELPEPPLAALPRYTGVYRFGKETLRSEALFDRKLPDVRLGADAPVAAFHHP